jgi:hypothetical protein
LIAGPAGAARAYTMQLLGQGEQPSPLGFRLTAASASSLRYAAEPLPLALPPAVTVAVTSGDALWVGTEALGVARASADGPALLGPSELVGEAERLTVACAARDRCYVTAGGDHAWITDGTTYRETRVGESDIGRVLALAGDGEDALVALTSEPGYSGLIVTRLGGGGRWEPAKRIPMDLPEGDVELSFASQSPSGVLWAGIRVVLESGNQVAIGAVELKLPYLDVNLHRFGKNDAAARPEQLPLSADATAILHDDNATWWSSRSGMWRWQAGQLRHWGEHDGMDSETCQGVALGPDGKIWAATAAGLARFEGKVWRLVGGGERRALTQGLVRDNQQRLWVAAARGLRVLDREAVARGQTGNIVVTDGMRHVTIDRYGRIWALGNATIALVDPARTAN